MTRTLKDKLVDWNDADVAMFHLARCLGVMGRDVPHMADAKHVFWSVNPVGDALYRILEELAKIGALEYDEEETRFRWNRSFKGSWEKGDRRDESEQQTEELK